jgi:subtilisin family serine protease
VYLAAVRAAADKGADVIHMSFPLEFSEAEFPGTFKQLKKEANETMEYAHTRGAILVAAAGNAGQLVDAQSNVFRFCVAKHVVCVSATGVSDVAVANTNYGPAIDVAGPGGTPARRVPLVCSTETRVSDPALAAFQCTSDPLDGWLSTGTSFGAAATSGLLAMLVDRIGKDRPDDVIEALRASTVDLGKHGKDDLYGHGRIDVAKAHAVPVP